MDLREAKKDLVMRHPWELTRADFIMSKINSLKPKRVIDIGSGDGYLGERISNELGISVLFVDKNFSEEQLARDYHYSHIQEIVPQKDDLILLADVLEHIEDPAEFMELLTRHFQIGSLFLLTVPAYQGLFSEHDSFLGHFRRYDKSMLRKHLGHNFEYIEFRYFFFLPFLIRSIQVLSSKTVSSKSVANWKYEAGHPVTLLSRILLRIDLGLSILPGLSLLAVGRSKK